MASNLRASRAQDYKRRTLVQLAILASFVFFITTQLMMHHNYSSTIRSYDNPKNFYINKPKVGLNKHNEKPPAAASSSKQRNIEIVNDNDDDKNYVYSHGNNLASLFLQKPLPLYMLSDILSSKIKKVSVVVSHCDHDLNWMAGFFGTNIKPTLIVKVWIFTKCNREVVGAPPGAEVVALPNVGRCDHTYAHWLSNYAATTLLSSNDEEEEIIFFTKDTGSEGPWGWGSRTFGDLLSLTILNGFSCMMLGDVPSYIHDYNLLRDFYWRSEKAHVRKGGITNGNANASFTSAFRNLGEWVDKLSFVNDFTQNIVPVCYGGIFAATMAQIRKQPKGVWENIEQSMSRGDNIEEAHFAERFWAALLSKPMSDKTASSIREKKPLTYTVDSDEGGIPQFFSWAGMMLPLPRNNEIIDKTYVYSHGNDLASLFLQKPLPLYMLSDILSSKIKKVSVVVSHCDHDLNWMAGFFGNYIKPSLIVKVWIFTKCNREVVGAPSGAEIIALPNVGRCEYIYAHWLSNYAATTLLSSDDDEEEIIFFTKDTGSDGGNWQGRSFGDLLSLTILNGFSCMMLGGVPSYIHDYNSLRGFYSKVGPSILEGRIPNGNANASFASEYSNLGEWADKLSFVNNFTQNIVPVCYGGIFATTMAQIRKQPKGVWENIEQSLSRGDNIEEEHFAERFWAALLSKPMSDETANIIREKKPFTYTIETFGFFNYAGMMLPPN